jgi:molecular chaperone DnaK (HSP70)
MPVRIGVDFGTTRTVVALADRGNYPVLSFFDEAGDAREWFPSVVAERGGELVFGFEALALARDPDATVLRSFKRLLADPHAVPSTPARVGGVMLPLGELMTRFLTAVREALLSRSNLSAEFAEAGELGATDDAELRSVIAVPAHAHGAQRFATLDAFRRAGFAPVAMLNEPSAAGFEFAHRHASALTSRRDHIVVYDLGGGTFDASLVRMRGRRHEVLKTAGLNRLGGDDFDETLFDLVCERAKLDPQSLSQLQRAALLEQCRDAKERISPSSRKLSIDLDGALGASAPEPEISLAVNDFYDACGSLMERTIDVMVPVMTELEGALLGDGTNGAGLAGIYVVGGASGLPLVARALRKRFGRRVHRSPYASAAVAIGLAIACDEAAGFELTDHYARTFGVFREAAAGQEITFDPIFTNETPVPTTTAEPFRCRRAYRAAHNIGHFRFLECSALGSDGRPRGDMVLSGDVFFPFDASLREGSLDLAAVPVRRTPHSGPRIEEEYALDEHGTVAVTIRNLDADYQRVYRVGG